MQLLEPGRGRGHGRKEYPVGPMWNSLIAALRRELLREGSYETCSVRPVRGRGGGAKRIRLYSLRAPAAQVSGGRWKRCFHSPLDELQIELPDLGQVQALEGRELHSLA